MQNPEKQRAIAWEDQINDLITKKRELEEDLKTSENGGPEERERLLQRVKDDNQEISSMERRIGDLEEATRRLQEQRQKLDEELTNHQSMLVGVA